MIGQIVDVGIFYSQHVGTNFIPKHSDDGIRVDNNDDDDDDGGDAAVIGGGGTNFIPKHSDDGMRDDDGIRDDNNDNDDDDGVIGEGIIILILSSLSLLLGQS